MDDEIDESVIDKNKPKNKKLDDDSWGYTESEKNMTRKDYLDLLRDIQTKIYNQIATKNEINWFFEYVHFLSLMSSEIEKIAPEVIEQAYTNVQEILTVENEVIN